MDYVVFSNMLKELGLSKEDFANIVGMNYNSVANWKAKGIPTWVESWLMNYQKAQKYEMIQKLIREK